MALAGFWKQRGGGAEGKGATGQQSCSWLPGQRSMVNSAGKAEGSSFPPPNLPPAQPGMGLDKGVSANTD